MTDFVRVELVPRTVPADENTQQWRQQVAGRLAELGHLDDPDTGSVDAPKQAWAVRLNGAVEVPLVAFAVEQGEDGVPLLSIVLSPDALSIGEPPQVVVPPAAVEQSKQPSTWGDPSAPDPRVNIPGWEPSDGQVAVNPEPFAEQSVRAQMGWAGQGATA